MPYRIAGIDVHKKKLAVVVADVEVEDEYQFERRWYGSNPEQLRVLSEWLIEQQIEEVVMESTAQYWKPVWGALERYWKPRCQSREGAGRMSGTLHLAQALSNRGRRGRKPAGRRHGEPRTPDQIHQGGARQRDLRRRSRLYLAGRRHHGDGRCGENARELVWHGANTGDRSAN